MCLRGYNPNPVYTGCYLTNQNKKIMENEFYPTVREVRQYADELKAQGFKGEDLVDKVCDFVFDNTSPRFELGDIFYIDNDFDHAYSPDINEEGYPILAAYSKGKRDRDADIVIPLTRGFSDTSERRDTGMYNLDVECACEEAYDKAHGKEKIYPWMLKQFASAEDFGITEEELDDELQTICGM